MSSTMASSDEGGKSKLDPTAEEWKLERKKEEPVSQTKDRPQKEKLEPPAKRTRSRQKIEKLEPPAKKTRSRQKIEELEPPEKKTRSRQKIGKLEPPAKKTRSRQKIEELWFSAKKTRLRQKEKKLEETKLKLEFQLQEMRLRHEIEFEKESQLMEMTCVKQKGRLLRSQLEKVRLRQEKEKPEFQLEEMRLRRELEKLESQLEEMRLRLQKEMKNPPVLRMILPIQKVVNVKSMELTSSEAVPQQQRTSGEPIGLQHIIVLGGRDQDGHSLKSVEGFIFREGRWIELPPMNTPRSFMSAVLVGNEILVSGGDTGATITDSIEILNLDETPLQWITSAATLPVPLSGHQTVAYKERLITIGGHDGNEGRNSDKIYEVLLALPYTTRVLGSLPQPRAWHGAELVNDKIFIFGGGRNPAVPNDDVLVYNLSSNQCNVISQLPYGVQGMATVRRWDEVTLLGGVDEREQELDHVITYDTESGETTTLPPMTQGRGGCCAVISLAVDTSGGCSSDTPTDCLVALGSLQQRNTVESYDFQSHAWRDMPPTREARKLCTAVVSPINFKFE